MPIFPISGSSASKTTTATSTSSRSSTNVTTAKNPYHQNSQRHHHTPAKQQQSAPGGLSYRSANHQNARTTNTIGKYGHNGYKQRVREEKYKPSLRCVLL
ncbi:Protein CBG26059 [Caenorhabditis briggsae]|uniref:Protein CBG26059 n=1 Tax=Caenorhabditis briggsae TaxID=6238 RepID=B6ILP2_CAEBR|nr:Protein CBG26059 [Caenorhabditis briggsae]CAS00822.1 Protein CBG26059 [Caenorhabditis briggsae]